MYLEKVDNSKQLNQRPSLETNGSSAELKVQDITDRKTERWPLARC